ncbi:MAG: helix-turn-helix domain-containing protein [Proteobacteria bacterium]|nr:helix-turn-helix domain-containing protein [Pseudomonadota bacterium]
MNKNLAEGSSYRLTIGELSKRTGCIIETIRYYERIGVMPAPPRTAGGHRIYDRDHLKRLNFVRRARALGFTLGQVRGLLALADERETSCAEVERLARAQLDQVRARIDDLGRMEGVLDEMVARCAGGSVPECPILEALFDGGDEGVG